MDGDGAEGVGKEVEDGPGVIALKSPGVVLVTPSSCCRLIGRMEFADKVRAIA